MNKMIFLSKKIGALALAIALMLGFSPFVLDSYAQAKSSPSLKEVRGRQIHELKLPIKYEKYASQRVKIKLYTTNTFTGEQMVTTHNRKLDNEGRISLRVDGLAPGTIYSFKVKIKKENSGDYSAKSDSKKGSTKLIGQK